MKGLRKKLVTWGALVLVAMVALASFTPLAWKANAAPGLVQAKYGSGTGTTSNAVLSSPTTTGDLVVVYVVWSNAGDVSLTDDQGNTYEKVQAANTVWANNYSSQVFYAKNVKGGATTITATFAEPVFFGVLYSHEYSGMDKVNPLDTATAASGLGVDLDSGVVTTTQADDLIFGAGASEGAVEAGGEGFTVRSTDEGNLTEDKTVTGAGSYSATATHGGGKWVMHAAAFKAADTTAPSAPASVTATASAASVVDLSWTASADNVGVTGYDVYRGGVKITTTTQTSYQDTGLSPNTSYTYTIRAFDAAGNISDEATATVGTPSNTCSLPEYPNANCTGVPAGTQLTDFLTATCTPGGLPGDACNVTAVDGTTCTFYREAENGPVSDPICAFTTANHVVDGMDIKACAEIRAPGVVIRNSKLSCRESWVVMSGFDYSGTPVLLEDDEISCMPDGVTEAAGKTGVTYNNYTLRRANIHSCENAVSVLENATIEDSYLHDLYVLVGVTHSDGVQIFQGATNLTLTHNSIDGGNGNSAITSPKMADGIASNVLIQDNLLIGGGYTLYCQEGGAGNNYRVINNHFIVGAYAPWIFCEDETEVRGNVYEETGELL